MQFHLRSKRLFMRSLSDHTKQIRIGLLCEMRHHPNMNKYDPDVEEKFQEINKAYEVLKDNQEHTAYDQELGLARFKLVFNGILKYEMGVKDDVVDTLLKLMKFS
ncbi:uncharacterized protein LOC141643627 [Silene latifolia]|uniref:uncharacterized protein LOC141643627 n=1 Tax=Silene latifolia TaxID=37657 RepID=UPI003D77E476